MIDSAPSNEATAPAGDLLAALASFPGELERTLGDHPPEALVRPASDGGWGVIENLCHLRDWEAVYLERVRAIIDRDHPDLAAYDDELWPIERDYRGDDPGRALAAFRERRAAVAALLATLDADGWRRGGRHEIDGEVNMRGLAERLRRHDDRHLSQIRDALA